MKNYPVRGFAIITAIFLLVILAAIGVAMVTLSTTQQTTSAIDVMGARAYQAARAGIEWALYQRLNPQVPPPYASPTYCSSSSAAGLAGKTYTFPMPSGTSLSPFTVTVKCTAYANAPVPAANQIVVRVITATACTQPSVTTGCPGTPSGTDYVERQVQVTLQEKF